MLPAKEAVETFLASMGDTADEVADWLRSHEIKGTHTALSCPIAVAIRRHFKLTGSQGVGVSRSGGSLYESDESSSVSLTNPEAVYEFIRRFDNEAYYTDLYGVAA